MKLLDTQTMQLWLFEEREDEQKWLAFESLGEGFQARRDQAIAFVQDSSKTLRIAEFFVNVDRKRIRARRNNSFPI